MSTLDLGTLFGYVDLETAPFDAKYTATVNRFRALGVEGAKAADGTKALDAGMSAVAESSSAASAGLTRADVALRGTSVSASQVVASARAVNAEFVRTIAVTTELGLAESKEAQAKLRAVAAQERLNVLQESGKATAAQLAAAQATLIAADDRVALSSERVAEASMLGAQSTDRLKTAWAAIPGPVKAGGAALLIGVGAAIKGASDFQKLTVNLVTGAGELQSNLHMVSSGILSMAGEVGDSASDLAKAMFIVESAGYHGAAGLQVLRVGAEGAKVDNADLTTTVDALTSALNDYQLPASDAAKVTNTLIASAAVGKMHLQDLAAALGTATPEAAALKVPLDQVGAAIATMTMQGTDAARASTYLRFSMAALANPTAKAQGAMAEVGITSEQVAEALTHGGLPAAFTLLEQAAGSKFPAGSAKYLAALANMVGGTRGLQAVLELTGSHLQVMNANLASIDARVHAAGNSVSDWSQVQKNFNVQLSEFIDGLEAAGIRVGEEMIPVVTDLLRILNATGHEIGDVTHFLDDNKGAVAVVAAALGTLLLPQIIAVTLNLARMADVGVGRMLTSLAVGAGAAGARLGVLDAESKASAGSLSSLAGKGGLVVGTVLGVYEAAKTLGDSLQTHTSPSVDAFTDALVNMAQGASTGSLELPKMLTELARVGNSTGIVTSMTKNLDTALTSLVTGGHLDDATTAFTQITAALHAGGMSTAQITALFPQYDQALANSATSAKVAGTGVDQYGNSVAAAGKKTVTATQEATNYANALKALTDPLFAEQQALADLRTKQDAYNKALQEHGADSAQAKAALSALAQSSITAAADSRALAASSSTAAGSIAAQRKVVDELVAAHELSRREGDLVLAQWSAMIDRAHGVSGAIASAAHGFETGSSKMENAAASAVSHVLQAFGVSTHRADALGAALAQGYADGMISKKDQVAAAASDLALIASASIKVAQQSSSPSKVTRKLGQDAGQGYALGFLDELNTVFDAASSMVARAIAAATAPAVTDPSQLASMLSGASTNADVKRTSAMVARQNYLTALQNSKSLDAVAKSADAAAKHAKSLASALSGSTAAEKAAKDQAEAHATALAKLATAADNTAKQADNAASRSKNVWTSLQSAAQSATQKAIADAQQLVSVMQSQFDTLSGQITSFEGDIQSGLTGDDSLSTLWGNLVDAQNTAISNLASAKTDYQNALDAVTQAGADATADQLQQLATSQSALQQAQQAADSANANVSAGGIQASVSAVLANAEQFAADLQTLISDGATQVEIDQIVGMGPSAGDQLAQALIVAGPDSVSKLGATLAQIASYTSDAATQMAGTFYGGGVNAMEQFIEGLEDSFPELASALAPILTQLQSLFSGTAGTSITYTGTPIVMPNPGAPSFAAGVTDFAGGLAYVHRDELLLNLPAHTSVIPRGGDGAASPVLRLHPEDRALLMAVAERPQQVVIDGKVVGESANNYRQARRRAGDSRFV